MIDEDLQQFIEGPVMLVIGSVGRDRVCAIGRAAGAWVAGPSLVEFAVSRWQWPATIANLSANAATALTVASPANYTCYQLKGSATLRCATDGEAARADRYIARTCEMLVAGGVPPTSSATWFSNRDLWLVSLAVADVFVQTPGPRAGHRRTPS